MIIEYFTLKRLNTLETKIELTNIFCSRQKKRNMFKLYFCIHNSVLPEIFLLNKGFVFICRYCFMKYFLLKVEINRKKRESFHK